MLATRKQARDSLNAIKTDAELREVIDSLRLSDEEKKVAYCAFGRFWTRQKIALEFGYSKRQVNRMMARIYDCIA